MAHVAMSRVNDKLEHWVLDRTRTPSRAEVVRRLETRVTAGVDLGQLRGAALRETRDAFVRSGRREDAEQLAYETHLALAATSLKRPFVSPELPGGTDRTTHACLSAALAAWVAEQVSRVPLMPASVARGVGSGVSAVVGLAKEVMDLGGSGFSRTDLAANWFGIRNAFRVS